MARIRSWLRSDRTVAVLLIAPSIVAIAIFVYGFIGWTGYVSLSRWSGLVPDYHFVGGDNYQRLSNDLRFQADIRNTIVFTALFLLSATVLGFLAAALLDQKIKGEAFFRGVFLFPMAISFIVTGIAWQWLFNPSTGVNLLAQKLGYDGPVPGWSTDANILFGFDPGKIEAGIRGVPEELREAARVDGASEWQVYRRVVLPLLRPVTLGVVVILGHISLKIFDLTVAMTGSGPNFTADMPAFYMFETTFRGNHFAVGAAIAMILLFLVATLVIPYLYFSLRREPAR